MNIKRENISFETIHKFGLTELLNAYRQDKERHPDDYSPIMGHPSNEWMWAKSDWYTDTDNANWIYKVTGFKTYLLYYEERLYEIRISCDVEGNAYRGGAYSETFYLKSIKALAPKESWDIITEKHFNRYSYNFTFKSDTFWGDVPYDKEPIKQSKLYSIKQYFKEALYSMEMSRLNEIIEGNSKRGNVDFNLEINIEMKW